MNGLTLTEGVDPQSLWLEQVLQEENMGKSIWLGVTEATSFMEDCPLLKCTVDSLCGQTRTRKILKVSYNSDKTQSFQ